MTAERRRLKYNQKHLFTKQIEMIQVISTHSPPDTALLPTNAQRSMTVPTLVLTTATPPPHYPAEFPLNAQSAIRAPSLLSWISTAPPSREAPLQVNVTLRMLIA